MEDYKKPLEEFIRLTAVPVIKISAEPGITDPEASKFGGVPWLPEGFSYPYATDGDGKKTPLKLLAQLNFAEMPRIPGLPDKGIIQFYIDGSDTLIGADFDQPALQHGFRVVFHPEPDGSPQLRQLPAFSPDDTEYFPVATEMRLTFQSGNESMGTSDFRFDRTFLPLYNRFNRSEYTESYELGDEVNQQIEHATATDGHKMGGYPFFTQSDPRSFEDDSKNATFLLLQIDSGDNIMWGDDGVANFFITPADLMKLDFSRVLYHWDCY